MNNKLILVGLGGFLIGVVVMIGVGAVTHPSSLRMGFYHDRQENYGDHHMMRENESNEQAKRTAVSENQGNSMAGMDHDMMTMMVTSEKDFLQQMIPHHEEAVSTAKEVVERGGSTPEIKELAQNIIIAQESEISQMKEWYKTWYGMEYVAYGSYSPMMTTLTELSGAALDKVFLSEMIMHHMGAIMMAKSVEPYIKHAEMTTLTKNIQSTQSAEIAEMENLLKTLPQ